MHKCLEGIVDEVALVDIGDEGFEVLIVVVDRLKELEKPLNDLHVGLTEALVEFNRSNTALDATIIMVGVLQIVEPEKDALILLKLSQNQRCGVLVYLLSIYRSLHDVGTARCCGGLLFAH